MSDALAMPFTGCATYASHSSAKQASKIDFKMPRNVAKNVSPDYNVLVCTYAQKTFGLLCGSSGCLSGLANIRATRAMLNAKSMEIKKRQEVNARPCLLCALMALALIWFKQCWRSRSKLGLRARS